MRLSGVLDINCQRRSSEKHEELQLKKPELVRRTRQDQASAKYSSIDLPTPRRREGEIVRIYGVVKIVRMFKMVRIVRMVRIAVV